MTPSVTLWNHWIRNPLWMTLCPVFMGMVWCVNEGSFQLEDALMVLTATLSASLILVVLVALQKPAKDTQLRVIQWSLLCLLGMATVIPANYLSAEIGIDPVAFGVASFVVGVFVVFLPWIWRLWGIIEVLLFLILGPIGMGMTVYCQSLQWSWYACLAGIAPGLLSLAVITMHHVRVKSISKRRRGHSLIARMGQTPGGYVYVLMLVGATVVPVILGFQMQTDLWHVLPSFFLLFTGREITHILTGRTETFAQVEKRTIGFLQLYTILFIIGWMM